MPDRIKILYDAVSKDYSVGSYDEFASKLQDEGKRKAFYDGVGAEYDLGDYETFSGKVIKKKASSVPSPIGSDPFSVNQKPAIPTVLTGEARKKAQEKFDQNKEKVAKSQPAPKKKPDGGAGTSFMKGLSSFNESIYKIPQYLFDVAAIPQNALAELTNNPDLKADYDTFVNSTGSQPPLSILRNLGRTEEIKAGIYDKQKEKFDKGVFDSIKDGDYSSAGKQILNNFAESAPSMIGMVVTGGAGNAMKLGKVGSTIAKTLPFASANNAELRDNPNVPDYIKPINATFNGLSEVIYDQEFGTSAIINGVAKSFTNEGREVAVKQAKDFVSGYITNAVKKFQPLTSGVKNAIEEMATQYSQNLVDKVTINPDKDLLEGLADAAIVGGVTGTAIQSVGTINGLLSSKKKQRLNEVSQRRSEIVDDLDNPNLPDEIKGDLLDQLEKENEKIAKISDEAESVISSLPEAEQKEALQAQEKIEVLEQSLNAEGVSEGTKQRIQEQIDTAQDKLDVLVGTAEILNKTDTEAQIIKEAQEAEKKFEQGGDQVEYEQKMTALDERAQKLPKPVEEVKAEPVAETAPLLVEETKTDVGSEISPDVSYVDDVMPGKASRGTIFHPAHSEKTLNQKQQELVNKLPKKVVNYKELKGLGDLSIYLNNPDALNSPHLKSAKKIYDEIKQGKPIRDTPSVNPTLDVMDGQNRIAAQLAAGITDIEVAVIDKSFYDKQNDQPTTNEQETITEETQAEVKEVVADKAVELKSKPDATEAIQAEDIGAKITPNKEVKANQKLASQEIAKVRGVKESDGEALFAQFKNKRVYSPEVDENLSELPVDTFVEDVPPILKGVFNRLEEQGFIEQYDDRYYLTDKGKEFNDAVQARLSTRKAVKSGTDMFPADAGLSADEVDKITLKANEQTKETKASKDQRPNTVRASVEGKREEVTPKQSNNKKPIKGDILFDNKKNKSVTVTKVSKPSRGSALENEPYIIDVRYEDGTKAMNMPVGDRFTDIVDKEVISDPSVSKTKLQTGTVSPNRYFHGTDTEGKIKTGDWTESEGGTWFSSEKAGTIPYGNIVVEVDLSNAELKDLSDKTKQEAVIDYLIRNKQAQSISEAKDIITKEATWRKAYKGLAKEIELQGFDGAKFKGELTKGNDIWLLEGNEDKITKIADKTNLQTAKEKLKEAKAKLDRLNAGLGIASDPKEKAKAFYDYHVALVEVAKEYISEGITTVQDFAKEIGEKVTKVVQDAWDEANGGDAKSVEDFEDSSNQNEPTEDELQLLGITKKEARRIREEQGEEQYEYDVKSRSELIAQADRMLAEGYNVPKLIKRITNGGHAEDFEVEILRRYFSSLTAAINKKPTSELLSERKSLLEALDHLKTRAGRAVQAFDGFIEVEDNLASFLQDESQYYDLSPEEVQELTEKYNKAKESLEKLQAKQKEALSKALNTKAQKKINEVKASRRASVREDFEQERKAIVDDFRAKLKQIRNTPNMVMLPYQNELIALAPFVKKLTESYVRQGVFELSEIVKGIHDEFKGDIPDLTEDDIRDLIAGEYTNPRNTKNAKLATVRDLETQARLERKIEELEAGIVSTKSPTTKRVKSDKITELEKQIREIKRRNPELTYPTRVQARKTWYANQISNLKNEIKEGKYDPIEPPTPVLLDAEALKLKDEYIAFKEQTRLRRAKKEHEALGSLQKNIRRVQQVLSLKRLIQTSLDLSIPLRQGVSVMLNPRTTSIGVKGYGKMLTQVFNEKEYQRMMFDIRSSDAFLESKDDGIVYTETSSSDPETRDESHPTESFLYKIPYIREPFRASERAAAAWTNYARNELYKRGVKMLKAQGKTRENAKQAYEAMAARVMVDTGRGKIPGIEDKSPSKTDTWIKGALGNTFYGARLMSSTFRKLNPLYYFNPKVDKSVRIEALKDMAGYVSSQIITTIAIAAATGATVSLDWDDPDFLKLRWGKRVVDNSAGQSTYIRTFMRLVNAVYNQANPYVSREDAEKYSKFTKQSVETFFRNKLAPNTSYTVNAFMGENTIGEKFDPLEIIKIYPMYGDDLVQAFQEGSPLDAAIILPIGISGLGYQEYSKDIRRARLSNYIDRNDTKLRSFLKKHQLNINGDINQEVYNLDAGMKVKMTKEQSDRYEKIWAESVIGEIKDEMSQLDELAAIDSQHEGEEGYKDKLKTRISAIKLHATKEAKEVISGVSTDMLTIQKNDKTYDLTSSQVKERQIFYKEYMNDNGDSKFTDEFEKAIEEGKPLSQAKRIAEKKVKAAANSYSREEIIKKYSDDDGNVLLREKE